MASTSLLAPLAAPAVPIAVERLRLADGAHTTVYVAEHDLATTAVRVAVLRRQAPLTAWCAAHGHEEALVGGFFDRAAGLPLGDVCTRGVARRRVPFDAPWGDLRACVHIVGGRLSITPRSELPEQPRGDLLQAGPLLVRDGRACFDREADAEGFSAGSAQFDSDITAGRHPRAALAIAGGRLLAVACDGRARREAGLTLAELADLLVSAGAEHALNLDGGGSTSLVSAGRLVNRPRSAWGHVEPGGRPISTALVFTRRT